MELHKYNKRYNHLIYYIDGCEREEVTKGVLNLSKGVIKCLLSRIRSENKFLLIPDACPRLNNNFMYVWDDGDNYLECEVFLSGNVEFFYKERTTNHIWGIHTLIGVSIPNEVVNKLLLFSI